jgi:hypothetical protein
MPVTCPAGHTSESTDYCDTCGAAIEPAVPAPASAAAEVPPPGTGLGPDAGVIAPCPNCGAPAGADDAFCEVCGIDFATGEMPTQPHPVVEVPPAAAAGPAAGGTGTAAAATTDAWVVVVEADRAFYEGNESPDVPLPFPDNLPAREVPLKSEEVLIGRRSDSRGVFPDVDLGAPHEDPGVSRRHAVLRHRPDGSWVVIDQGSTNGTRVSGTSTPVQPGEERPLLNGDQLLLGAWTRITLKRATSAT